MRKCNEEKSNFGIISLRELLGGAKKLKEPKRRSPLSNMGVPNTAHRIANSRAK